MRDYERLSVEDFGQELLASNDLDPVYVALGAVRGRDTYAEARRLCRWFVAYWCYYDCGLASWMADQEDGYWDAMEEAAQNLTPSPVGGRWPRGRERRHFRGANGVAAVRGLRERYQGPEDMVNELCLACPASYRALSKMVMEHYGFGPWIAFKVADMLERVVGAAVDFSSGEIFMYDQPRDAALMLYEERRGTRIAWGENSAMAVSVAVQDSVDYLAGLFSHALAPPRYERPVGFQEVETVLCKWKSHRSGHYPLFNDIREIREGIEPWLGVSDTAGRFLAAMPPLPRRVS